MGLFSLLKKNKQEAATEDSGYYSSADDTNVAAQARSKRASNAGGAPSKRGKEAKAVVDPILPEKKRARRRLVGAIALALAVAVGLPMVLDAEPKPLASDIAIQIPSKDKVAPLPVPAVSKPDALPSKAGAGAALDAREQQVEAPVTELDAKPTAPIASVAAGVAEVRNTSEVPKPSKEAAQADTKAAHAAEPKGLDAKAAQSVAKAPSKAEEKKVAQAAKAPVNGDAARALAILEGKPVDKARTDTGPVKYVVQVAALATQEKVTELRDKLKGAGIKSFTQKVSTQSGDRIRVQVGPFGSKDEAEKTQAKIKQMGLSANLVPT